MSYIDGVTIGSTTYDLKDSTLTNATESVSGLMSATDKAKLNQLAPGTFTDLGFTITPSDWTAGTNEYTYTFTNAAIGVNTTEDVYFDKSVNSACASWLTWAKDNTSIVISTGSLPIANVVGKIRVLGTSSEHRIVEFTGTTVPIAKGGTGAANAAGARTNLGLGNVEDKSSATIRGEITSSNVTTALGYIPAENSNATQSTAGLMSSEDKTKLDGIAEGATANVGTITKVQANGTNIASSGVANIPAATASEYGVTKLHSGLNSSSTSLSATAYAVKTLNDAKAPKSYPVFTGSISMGRKSDTVDGDTSVAVGTTVTASGSCSFATGYGTTASGSYAHAEGHSSTASDLSAHAEGQQTTASSSGAHSEGISTTASNVASHAEGQVTTASGYYSHAEGYSTTASHTSSHAEGTTTVASGSASHSEGQRTIAGGAYSHVEGYYTVGYGQCMHVSGKYNKVDVSYPYWVSGSSYAVGDYVINDDLQRIYVCKTANSDTTFDESKWTNIWENTAAEIVGGGASESLRKNIRQLDWNGNERIAGSMYVNCAYDSTGGKKLIPIETVSDTISSVSSNTTVTKSVTGDAYLINVSASNPSIFASDVTSSTSSGTTTFTFTQRAGVAATVNYCYALL